MPTNESSIRIQPFKLDQLERFVIITITYSNAKKFYNI